MIKYLIELCINHTNSITATLILFFSLFYIFKRPKEHSEFVKVLGLLLILSLTLFGNNIYLYFLSVVVIASLFVSNTFLEKVVAIILRNNDYFEYKIKELTKNEKEEKIIEKIENATTDNSTKREKSAIKFKTIERSVVKQYTKIQKSVFEYLRKQYGYNIREDIKIVTPEGYSLIFDGITKTLDRDIIFEVKMTNCDLYYVGFINDYVASAAKYKAISKNNTEIQFIFISPEEYDVNGKRNITDASMDSIIDHIKIAAHTHSIMGGALFLTFNDIGYSGNSIEILDSYTP